MCGITGIFHFENGREVDGQRLKKMTDLIDYRGPDGEGFHLNRNVGLGHRRLSIIDLSSGDQPMYNDDKSIVVVLNGEIYNYIELKEELAQLGHTFKTTSDTEVVIKAYEQWGVECQSKFNGMWAIALWDERKQQLFISRDRIGEKPVHYAIWDNTLIFGSEIKSILEYGVPREPQFELLEVYAVFKSIPAPNTFFKHIKKLMPGHFILATADGIKEQKYWDLPSIDEGNMNNNAKQIYEKFEELFTDSIRIRMRCDVPFGAFLSGGLDSASIVAIMSGQTPYPVQTFTIGYSESEFDESKLAELVAKKYKTEHHLGTVTQDDFEVNLDRIVHHYDEPFGDSSAIPTGQVSRFAAEKVKMVLTGDGGDEVLSGYSTYQGVKFAQTYQEMPKAVQQGLPKMLSATSSIFKGGLRYKLNRYGNLFTSSSQDYNTRLLHKRAKPEIEVVKALINPDIKTWGVEDYIQELMAKSPYKDDFYKQMYLNFKFDLPNDYLVKVDRMSMAASLETRLPFLDHRLIEFMATVDKKVKMQGWERKSVLRKTIGKKLPKELLGASKKGFRVPVREWFKDPKLQDRLCNLGAGTGLFNTKVLAHLVQDNASGKSDNGNLIWSLSVLDGVLKK